MRICRGIYPGVAAMGMVLVVALTGRAADERTPEQEAVAVVDLFYNLQFDRALAAAESLDDRFPKSPAGLFYRGVALYQRYLLEDPASAETFAAFEASNRAAMAKAEALTGDSPAMSHYYRGAVLGFEARAFVAQDRYRAAIPKARQGVHQLRQALEKDPSLLDAKLGIGMYYYFLTRIPPAAKPFAYLMMGMWGDRDKGLSLLEEVAQHGHAASSEARSVLASIYSSQREQLWDRALPLLHALNDQYPQNPRYRLRLVYVYQRLGAWEKALAAADPGGRWIQHLDPLIRDRADSMAAYRAVECLLFAGRAAEAGVWLDRLESGPEAERLAAWLDLRRGNYWDALGQAEKSRPLYERVSGKKAKGLAAHFLAEPFPAGPRDVMPARWPVSNIPIE